MCGILGSINLDFNDKVLNQIYHRGPDDFGYESFYVHGNKIILAHRRLSILDLSESGHQPMISHDKKYAIIYNGEVYNHKHIRKNLDKSIFKGHSDTETLLHALIQYGIKAVDVFNGIFGFCFLDKPNGKLYLCRDPFGVKPVYYCQEGKRFCFSSEIGPLRSLVDNGISLENIATLLRLRYVPSPNTIYKNIYKLRPGHYLEICLKPENLDIKEIPYLRPLPSEQKLTFQEALQGYEEYFNAAVKRQLMGDVEVGIMLSGGIDSALVAAEAQRSYSYPLKAFTVGFTEKTGADEIGEAIETAAILGLEHYHIRISEIDFYQMLEECVNIVEEPLSTTSMIPMYFLSQLASSKVKVVLTGQGADEPLGGYGRYRGEILSSFIPPWAGRLIATAASQLTLKQQTLLRGAYALSEPDIVKRFLRSYEVFNAFEIWKLIGVKDSLSEERYKYFYGQLNCNLKKNSVENMMALDARMNLADDLLLYTDKITMRHSLECRVPFLDIHLVNYIESLPLRYRLSLFQSKIIHKKYSQKILSSKIVQRPKKSFASPTAKWFTNSNLLKEKLLGNSGIFRNIFNLQQVNKIIEEHANGFNRERHIFLLLCLKYILNRY